MGRQPCCAKNGLRKGPWTVDEDHKLKTCILNNGIQCWPLVPKLAGLMRCGKSCRLRWINYLRPDLKKDGFTEAEEDMIIQLQSRLGNSWSKIATHFPGHTDNEIKNYWNSRLKKKKMFLALNPRTNNTERITKLHSTFSHLNDPALIKEEKADVLSHDTSWNHTLATSNNLGIKEERAHVFKDETPVTGDIDPMMSHDHELECLTIYLMRMGQIKAPQHWIYGSNKSL